MLTQLPDELHVHIFSQLPQKDQAAVSETCWQLRVSVDCLLSRVFCCVGCGAKLFRPAELNKVKPPGPRTRLVFLSLRPRTPCLSTLDISEVDNHGAAKKTVGSTSDADALRRLGLTVDKRHGAANFHVLRHLAQTMFCNERFPLAQELAAVYALRCATCCVFVGFRKTVRNDVHDFIHQDFVELCDLQGRLRALDGRFLRREDGIVRCATENCANELFDKRDMLEWTHVLSSTRLLDFDPYLEWDHSWAGGPLATSTEPALFVKRLKKDSHCVGVGRMESLRQGDMEVADVSCSSCGAHVGWKFLSEVARNGVLHNYDQVGRFGIVRSAVTPSDPRRAGL